MKNLLIPARVKSFIFASIPFLAHLTQRGSGELLPSLGVRRPSVNFLKNLLL